MASNPDGFDRQVVEQTLCQIADVQAARIVTGAGDKIDELHVLATSGKGPKQIVRDIESTLQARFGLSLDHRKISIAQISEERLSDRYQSPNRSLTGSELILSADSRPKVSGIQAETGGEIDSVVVRLQLGEATFEGKCEGKIALEGRGRLVARAALEAVKLATGSHWHFHLEDVDIVRLGRQSVAVTCFQIDLGQGEEVFCGSAIVGASEDQACVRSVLDGINRRFGSLKS